MDIATSREPISIEDAHRLVHSLPDRVRRITRPSNDRTDFSSGLVPIASVTMGALLSFAAFSNRVPPLLRYGAGAGAIMSAGALGVFCLTSILFQSGEVESKETTFKRFLKKVTADKDLREELAQYLACSLTKGDMTEGIQSDMIIVAQALRFGEQKKLLDNAKLKMDSQEEKAWTERSVNSGKQLLLSGSS